MSVYDGCDEVHDDVVNDSLWYPHQRTTGVGISLRILFCQKKT